MGCITATRQIANSTIQTRAAMLTASRICLCRSVIATSSGGAASHDVSSSNLVMLHRPRPLVRRARAEGLFYFDVPLW